VYTGTVPPKIVTEPERNSGLGIDLNSAEDDLGEIVDDENKGVGQQELVDLLLDVDPPQQARFDEHGDEGHAEGRRQHREEESPGPRDLQRDPVDEIRPEHVERAVGEVEDVEHAEDEGEPRRDEEQERRLPEGAQDLHRQKR
jgi:hypothetical protein